MSAALFCIGGTLLAMIILGALGDLWTHFFYWGGVN